VLAFCFLVSLNFAVVGSVKYSAFGFSILVSSFDSACSFLVGGRAASWFWLFLRFRLR
jgi:hypothetical protein